MASRSVPGWSGMPSECRYGRNGDNSLPVTGYGGNGPTVVPVLGNGHREEPAEGQQSLFSRAGFLAGEPAQPQGRNGKPKPSSLSLFE